MVLVFSVAVTGNGQMLEPFVNALKAQFPQVTVYNRNEETLNPDSETCTPSPADFDAIFTKTGSKETATIRSFYRHRFFNYDLDDNPEGSKGAELLLKSMLQSVNEMLTPPKQVQVPEKFPAEEEDATATEENETPTQTESS